ncbi:MAG: T9SS type A sorting domain-containing protein [Bacteroidota bacterium]
MSRLGFFNIKFFFIFVFLFLALLQNYAQRWERYYEHEFVDRGNDVIPTSDGGYVVTGAYNCNDLSGLSPTLCQLFAMKVDGLGNEEWFYSYGDSILMEEGFGAVETLDGGYITVGNSFNPTMSFTSEGVVLKINAQGHEEWIKIIEDTINTFILYDIKEAVDDGYIITGVMRDNVTSYGDNMFLLKIDEQGNEEWRNNFGFLIQVEQGLHVQTTQDGGYLVVGSTGANIDGTQAYIVKTNVLGNEEWSAFHGEDGKVIMGTSSTQLDDGSFIVTLNYDVNSSRDFRVLKISEDGNEEWMQTFAGHAATRRGAGTIGLENNEVIIAYTTGSGGLIYRKLDTDGNELWYHHEPFISNSPHIWGTTCKAHNGGFITTGAVIGDFLDDIALIKADSLGRVVVSVDNINNSSSKLFEVYPNPMQEQVNFKSKDFSIREVDIIIYDSHGKVIINKSEEVNPIVDASQLPLGIYYYKIKAEDFIQNGKLVKVE